MHSCLYEGAVAHHRRDPVTHRFRYGLVLAYLDLDELPELVGPGRVLSDRKWSAACFRREDRLFDATISLQQEVRQTIARALGQEPAGPIRLLTQLRWFGYYFSPLNLYYVFDAADERVEHVLAEVNNTPWNERHAYVLTGREEADDAEELRFRHAKAFHVSPFMSLDGRYRWRLGQPGESLRVSLARQAPGQRPFDANLMLHRSTLTRASLRRVTVRYPLMTAQVISAIYYQAFKLWWKACPYYPHPTAPLAESSR